KAIGSNARNTVHTPGHHDARSGDASLISDRRICPQCPILYSSPAAPASSAPTSSGARLVREGAFDVICHLAAQIDVRKSVEDPAYDVAVNIGGSLNLLEAMRQSGKKTTRFIFSSTGGALYGDVETLPTPEDFPKD